MSKKSYPFMVKLTWQDQNMPPMYQGEQTEDLALATVRDWLNRFAAVKSVVLEDVGKRERHIFTYAGYFLTVPVL